MGCDCGKGNLELLNLPFAPILGSLCCGRARSCPDDAGMFLYQHCGPRHHPQAGPGSPSQHWGGNGGEEQNPHPKGEIICSLCPFLEKKSKKILPSAEPSLSHPLCREELGRGCWKKAKRVFKRQLEKREGGGRKNLNPQKNPRQGGSSKPGTHSPFQCPGRWRNPIPGAERSRLQPRAEGEPGQ